MDTILEATENCWSTGIFSDECDCESCLHKDECSGYNGDEDGENLE